VNADQPSPPAEAEADDGLGAVPLDGAVDWATFSSRLDDDPDREASSTAALFEGDEGGLDEPARRALVVLVKTHFISAQTHPREWKALAANPRPIRSRLNDMFLDLHLDIDREVAYKRQVRAEGSRREFPTLLYDAAWGREDTILLAYLRTRYRSEQAAGADRVYVDRDDMLETIAGYRPAHATDASGDAKKAVKAIETVYKTGLLIGASTAERFQVSNAIEVLLHLEKLQELLSWLRTQNGTQDDTGTGEADGTETAQDTNSEAAADPGAAEAASTTKAPVNHDRP
jgi:hypothetical protein